MSNFDIAIGIGQSALNTGLSEVYKRSEARESFFKGSRQVGDPQNPMDATYDVLDVPRFELSPDDAVKARWTKSIDNGGKFQTGSIPSPNVFVLILPKLRAEVVYDPTTKATGTGTNTTVFCQAKLTGRTLRFEVLTIWVDESAMSVFDQEILNGEILPTLLDNLAEVLKAIQIPPLEFAEGGVAVELIDPLLTITGQNIVLASCLKGNGAVDLSGFAWPNEQIFALVSSRSMIKIAEDAGRKKLVGKTLETSGSIAGGTASYSGSARINSLTVTFDATNMTLAKVTMGVALGGELKPLGVGGPCAVGAATANM